MPDIKSTIIQDMWVERGNMAVIIGRYKGSMEIFAEKLNEIIENDDLLGHTKFKLELLASKMEAAVHHNEQLWAERCQSKEATAK